MIAQKGQKYDRGGGVQPAQGGHLYILLNCHFGFVNLKVHVLLGSSYEHAASDDSCSHPDRVHNQLNEGTCMLAGHLMAAKC